MSVSDMFNVFFEEGEMVGSLSQSSDDDGEEQSAREGDGGAESKMFWDTQHELLQEAMNRSGSVERRIRRDTEAAVKRMHETGVVCCCVNRTMKGDCRDCVLRGIVEKLKDLGHNSALCTSRWRRTMEIPSGEHSYIDVIVDAQDANKSPIRLVIELNFRAEFEMARANQEYTSLVSHLPELFVGKSEKLRNVIRIVCEATKKCMKENKMHMAPWRKHKYMQAKWLGTCERMPGGAPLLPVGTSVSDRQPKQRASMLTFDLHRTAVEVL